MEEEGKRLWGDGAKPGRLRRAWEGQDFSVEWWCQGVYFYVRRYFGWGLCLFFYQVKSALYESVLNCK